MIELCALTDQALADQVAALGQSAFRARQIREWLNRARDIDEMSNLPERFRAQLRDVAIAMPATIERCVASNLDGTEKYLFALPDGNLVEGVLMRYHHGDTLCISTQVGCKMGCAFCASTLDGCVRNLTPGELLSQILRVNRRLETVGEKVHNVVMMGSGEPLDNYDHVVTFLQRATDPSGLNLSIRGISLSTCGLVPRILRFADEGLPVTLSLSLHAPNDGIRRKLMPIANVYGIDETLAACRTYVEKTGRRVIIEYALVDQVNCATSCADELARRLRGLRCHVNLIPLNEVKERSLRPPSKAQVQAFLQRLTERGVSATVRREMGDDIQGACGQLRRHVLSENK